MQINNYVHLFLQFPLKVMLVNCEFKYLYFYIGFVLIY